MEGRKIFMKQADPAMAKNENEARRIRICNAAMIGAVKNFNRYQSSHVRWEDIEDAVADAQLAALERVSADQSGLGYADACGRSSAIKACQKAQKKDDTTTRIEGYWNEEEGWTMNSEVLRKESEECTFTSDLEEKEESSLASQREAIVRACMSMLPKDDQMMVELRSQGLAYKEISEKMGCNLNTIQKRSHDCKKRFKKLLANSGYYGLM